jgi:hypothetical protein
MPSLSVSTSISFAVTARVMVAAGLAGVVGRKAEPPPTARGVGASRDRVEHHVGGLDGDVGPGADGDEKMSPAMKNVAATE